MQTWAEPFERVDAAVSGALDAAEPVLVSCALCGAEAELTEEVLNTWFPDVWIVYSDGSEKNLSIVCNARECVYDADSGAYLIGL